MTHPPFPVALLFFLSACGTKPAQAPSEHASAVDVASAVALVDGIPISAVDIARQAAAAGTDAPTALSSLVDERVLEAEARRLGFDADASVLEAGEREMVRRFLALGFEKDVTAAVVTASDIERAYQKNITSFDHPEMNVVLHILAPATGSDPPARREAARRRAETVAVRARAVHDIDGFRALVPALTDDEIKLKGEELATGRVGFTVRPFAEAAFSLAKVGDTSGVVETRFGYHVIYLKEKIPALFVPLAKVEGTLRTGLWPDVRKRVFNQQIDGLVEHHKIEVSPGLLDEKTESNEAK